MSYVCYLKLVTLVPDVQKSNSKAERKLTVLLIPVLRANDTHHYILRLTTLFICHFDEFESSGNILNIP